MKTKLSIFAIIIMAFFAMAASPVPKASRPLPAFNKVADVFSFVRTHRQGKGATITWAFVSPNASCFIVQRTYEDPNDQYSNWEGICNTPCNSSRSYKFTEENVFPGFVNYRVVAFMNDGSTVTSEISGIRIVGH